MLYCTCTELELSSLPLPLTFPPQQPRHSHLERYFTLVEHFHFFFFFFFFITRPSVDEWRQSGFKILSSQVTSNRPLGCTLKHNVSKIAPNRRQQFWLKLFRWRTIHCQKEKKHLEDKRLWKVSTHNLSVSKYEEYEVSHFNGIYPLF